ncbi:centromere protein J [Atheta coriaria]|uniref:centromere protein J n=1 Tax=Dalotia coriaria TaxID=877792 RepID=UPI0031F3B68D
MAMSPSSLLAKLDELKRWQQIQQERLLKQHQTRLEAANSLFPHLTQSRIEEEKEETKEISSVVHEQVDNEEAMDDTSKSPGNITKKPFLKRGTGLVKYGLQYGDQKKPFNKMKPLKVYKTAAHKRINQIKTDDQEEKFVQSTVSNSKPKCKPNIQKIDEIIIKTASPPKITPLRAPEMSIKQKAKWCPVEPEDYEPPCLPTLPATLPSGSLPGISHISEEESQQNVGLQMLQNNPELFHALQRLATEHFGPANGDGTASFDQTDLLNKLTLLDNESTIYQTPINNNHTQLVQYLQNLLQRCENNTPGDLTTYENALAKELRVFEQLEEKAMNSSFCSTNSSVMELLASTPNRITKGKVPSFETIQENCNNMNRVQVQADIHNLPNKISTGTQNSYSDFDNDTLQSKNSSNAKKMLIYPHEIQQSNDTLVQNDYSDESSINSDDFDHTTANIVPEILVRQNAATMTDPIDTVNEDLLKVKLKELETEILSFRSENKKVEKLKSDLERQRSDIIKSKKSLEKEYNSKREELECEFDEERKKLNKEKQVFEKYSKEIQNKPNRKEREEISNLKAELANVKETLKVKETRNGTTQARLRTQIKSLEKDNAHLKEEIEKLQKVNARLQNQTQVSRKGRQDETKMLHEINKNLTKLTNDQKVAKALNKLENSIEDKISSEDSLITLSTTTTRRKPTQKTTFPSENKQIKSHKSKKHVQNEQIVITSDSEEETKNKNQRKHKVIVVTDESSSETDILIHEQSNKSKRRSNDYETEYRRSYSRSSYKSDSEDEMVRPKSKNRSRSSLESRKSLENKENESSNGDITTFRNLSDLSVSENYEKVFGARGKQTEGKYTSGKLKRHNSLNDTQQTNSKIETILTDGSKETKYPNGNVKTVSPDGNLVKMEYFNGDIKETALLEGTIKYFYKDTQIWQTTFATGDETFEFPDGQVEKHLSDGSSTVHFPNGIVKHMSADGSEQINYPDGSVVNIKQDGEKILLLANGQKEIHTDKHKRREYPDGTVKIIYADGLQETRYSNGRIRMKDIDGNLIMDSHKD